MMPMGRTRWAIAEGYIPSYSHGPEPQFTSHETACLLNSSDQDAHVAITIFYSDREPVGPYRVIESDVPIVVQHTRLDSRQAENALVSTIAFAANE